MRALRKGRASAFYYGDPETGEMRTVSRVLKCKGLLNKIKGCLIANFATVPSCGFGTKPVE